MRYIFIFLIIMVSCNEAEKPVTFTSVTVSDLYTDSLSIRAIELMGNSLAFAANNGTFGTVELPTGKVRTKVQTYDTIIPDFRAIAHTATDFFMLSAGSPALLYKTGENGRMELVYKEEGEGVFYDAMTFLNDREGIAVGDSVEGCLSIIITRDGGKTWLKLACSQLPVGIAGEGAFAASNTNIKTIGDMVWIATTNGRIFYSMDKGKQWKVFKTPIRNNAPTEGIYAIDFFDEALGIAIGGDYTAPENKRANKAISRDGGITWQLMADGREPGYKSCIQFVPGSDGFGLMSVGFTGISYSSDKGEHWKKLSNDSFYTIRFQNDSVAFAAGKNRISKLVFH